MTNKQLNRKLLSDGFSCPEDVTVGNKQNFPVKVLQFGEGNFLRAFIDWMIDVANSKNLFSGSVTMVQPIEKGLTEMVNEQDGLYTLLTRGIQNGEVVEEKRLITCVKNCINPYENWQDVISTVK